MEIIIVALLILIGLVCFTICICTKKSVNNYVEEEKSTSTNAKQCSHNYVNLGHNSYYLIQQCTKCGEIRRIKLF